MAELLSLIGMVEKLALAEVAIHAQTGRALERVAQQMERTAKSEFGTYQPEVGPFPEWAELAESTQEERVRLGFTANDPLQRTDELRDSISHEASAQEAVVGSTSDIMPYHEFGTDRIPPRPVLGPAAVRNHDVIVQELGGAVVNGLVGRDVIHPSLGYDADLIL